MSYNKMDCRGMACPHPVINTKKELDKMDSGTLVTVVDNDTARENVTLFARNAGCEVSVEKKGNDYYISISKGNTGGDKQQPYTATPVPTPTATSGESAGTVYFITGNCLGQGSPDLGLTLMKSLMTTLDEMNPPPRSLIFLNSGVYLACKGSEVLAKLKSMDSKGVNIQCCGTCLEYYKLKEKLAVGRISNMYDINNTLNAPGKVITIP
jgi:selenium metabolism protein YedF